MVVSPGYALESSEVLVRNTGAQVPYLNLHGQGLGICIYTILRVNLMEPAGVWEFGNGEMLKGVE